MAAFIVHTLPEAVAALTAAAQAGRFVQLFSPRHAVRSLGAGYFLTMIARARRMVPAARSEAVLDCGDAAGLALAALAAGADAILVRVPAPVLAKLEDIAAKTGVRLIRDELDSFCDLATANDPLSVATAFLVASTQ